MILVGGLGLGFTLRAALNMLPHNALVFVAEIVPAIVQWNNTLLGGLAGHPCFCVFFTGRFARRSDRTPRIRGRERSGPAGLPPGCTGTTALPGFSDRTLKNWSGGGYG